MNEHSVQTGVYTDHCNYGALGESSFLCRFICHINKWISSTYGGWWQQEKFEKINELWQCGTWGEKSVAISSGLCWQSSAVRKKKKMKRGQWLLATGIIHPSPLLPCLFLLWLLSHTAHTHDIYDWRCYSAFYFLFPLEEGHGRSVFIVWYALYT